MPITSKVKGDLVKLTLSGTYDFTIHGCNCQALGLDNGGIALQLFKAFPELMEVDKSVEHKRNNLGCYSFVELPTGFIINAYTQVLGGRNARYYAIMDVFRLLNEDIRDWEIISDKKAKVGIPQIGSGIGGLDWELVEQIINEVTPSIDIELVVYDGG